MLLWQSKYGKIKFINEITGTYRKHPGGIYSAQSEVKRKEQIILTDLVSLELIEPILYSKYFGMLFKKLVEVRFLNRATFKKNKTGINQAFKTNSHKMSMVLKFKIRLSFFLVSLPLIQHYKGVEVFLIRVFNYLFIY